MAKGRGGGPARGAPRPQGGVGLGLNLTATERDTLKTLVAAANRGEEKKRERGGKSEIFFDFSST